jgi:dethiobiotin synthetase
MKLFVTGIGTDVGKTIVASIVTEALQADYWKPIQAGDTHNSDSDKVKKYITNAKTVVFPNSYCLTTPASPHAAAALDNITIDCKAIIEPETENHLVIEGAGGIFVPLNNEHTIIDIIKPDYKVIVVSRHYLGSINHTLLTIEALRSRNITIAGIVFNGDEISTTEDIILSKTGIRMLGRVNNEPYFDKNVILDYADDFRENLLHL